MSNVVGWEYLKSRGISVETATQLGIHTCRSGGPGNAPIADPRGNILAFPSIERGQVVNEKFRAEPKRFWQKPGGKRTFWNSDVLDDPAVIDGRLPVVITEGEFDAAAAVESGMPTTVSVPDGAPPEGPVSEDGDEHGKFEFLFRNRERLRKVKRFVLAVDNDGPGLRLSDELVRRLGAWRCCFVTYPDGCKDLNDVLLNEGPEEVVRVINNAQPFPVRGLYRLGDYPQRDLVTYSTGWRTLDRHCQLWFGEFVVISGIPSMGKSTFVLNLLANTALTHGWKAAIFSPEMPTVPHLCDKLTRIVGGRVEDPHAFINNNFTFIDTDPNGADEDDLTLDWILERATDAVMRDGIRMLVLDPWNEIEQMRNRDETQTEYIARAIRQLKRFAKQYGVIIVVIAHPTKDVNERGKPRVPNLYDIDGSAAWFNKCDHGLVVHRPDATTDITEIHVAKSRFEQAGEKGMVKLRYDRYSSRYELLAPLEAPLL